MAEQPDSLDRAYLEEINTLLIGNEFWNNESPCLKTQEGATRVEIIEGGKRGWRVMLSSGRNPHCELSFATVAEAKKHLRDYLKHRAVDLHFQLGTTPLER
jgi:hypothetical protein